jgi:hypothetical protein
MRFKKGEFSLIENLKRGESRKINHGISASFSKWS